MQLLEKQANYVKNTKKIKKLLRRKYNYLHNFSLCSDFVHTISYPIVCLVSLIKFGSFSGCWLS